MRPWPRWSVAVPGGIPGVGGVDDRCDRISPALGPPGSSLAEPSDCQGVVSLNGGEISTKGHATMIFSHMRRAGRDLGHAGAWRWGLAICTGWAGDPTKADHDFAPIPWSFRPWPDRHVASGRLQTGGPRRKRFIIVSVTLGSNGQSPGPRWSVAVPGGIPGVGGVDDRCDRISQALGPPGSSLAATYFNPLRPVGAEDPVESSVPSA